MVIICLMIIIGILFVVAGFFIRYPFAKEKKKAEAEIQALRTESYGSDSMTSIVSESMRRLYIARLKWVIVTAEDGVMLAYIIIIIGIFVIFGGIFNL